MHKAALIRGDGIGREICEATQKIIEATGVTIDWQEAPMGLEGQRLPGSPIPLESLAAVRGCGAALKGPMIANRCSGGVAVEENGQVRPHPSINSGIRRELGTYPNLRTIRGWEGVSGPYARMDVAIVRKLTEGIYAGIERRGDADTVDRQHRHGLREESIDV